MSDLLKALEEATEADLEAMRREVEVLKGKLNSLCALIGILSARFSEGEEKADEPVALPKEHTTRNGNGVAEKKVSVRNMGGRPPSDETTRKRMAIARLLQEDGVTDLAVIKNRLGFVTNCNYLVEHPWFSKGPSGYSLTPAGGRALEEKKET